MLVMDASAVAELLLARPAAREIERHVGAHRGDLHAPHLLDLEVLSTLRRLVTAGLATTERADEAIDDLLALRIDRYPHAMLVPRAWELRANFTPYDAAYVALAESLVDGGAPLLTTDRRFARAAAGHSTIEVLVA